MGRKESNQSLLKDQCDQCAVKECQSIGKRIRKTYFNKEFAKRNKETDKQTAKKDQSCKGGGSNLPMHGFG